MTMALIFILQCVKTVLGSLTPENSTKEGECVTLYIKSTLNISEIRMIDTTVKPGIVIKTIKVNDGIQCNHEKDEDGLAILKYVIKIEEEKEFFLRDKFELNILSDNDLIGILSDFSFYENDLKILSVNLFKPKLVFDKKKGTAEINQSEKNINDITLFNSLDVMPKKVIYKKVKKQKLNAKQFINSILSLENEITPLIEIQAAYNKEIQVVNKKIGNIIYNIKTTLSEHDKKTLKLQEKDLSENKKILLKLKINNEIIIDEKKAKKKGLFGQLNNVFDDHYKIILESFKCNIYVYSTAFNDHIDKKKEVKRIRNTSLSIKNLFIDEAVGEQQNNLQNPEDFLISNASENNAELEDFISENEPINDLLFEDDKKETVYESTERSIFVKTDEFKSNESISEDETVINDAPNNLNNEQLYPVNNLSSNDKDSEPISINDRKKKFFETRIFIFFGLVLGLSIFLGLIFYLKHKK